MLQRLHPEPERGETEFNTCIQNLKEEEQNLKDAARPPKTASKPEEEEQKSGCLVR